MPQRKEVDALVRCSKESSITKVSLDLNLGGSGAEVESGS
jgi:hypothetical protein